MQNNVVWLLRRCALLQIGSESTCKTPTNQPFAEVVSEPSDVFKKKPIHFVWPLIALSFFKTLYGFSMFGTPYTVSCRFPANHTCPCLHRKKSRCLLCVCARANWCFKKWLQKCPSNRLQTWKARKDRLRPRGPGRDRPSRDRLREIGRSPTDLRNGFDLFGAESSVSAPSKGNRHRDRGRGESAPKAASEF